MPTENRSSNTEMVSVRQHEDRYIVIKRSDLDRIPGKQRLEFSRASRIVHDRMFAAGAPPRQFLVIESDWPEYALAWASIEARVLGAGAEPLTGSRLLELHSSELRASRMEIATLRAQLAERDALLREWLELHRRRQQPVTLHERTEAALSASAEPSASNDCAICRDLGDQCVECEEGEFREWADRHFAAADYRKTHAGVFIRDWMRHAYAAWCARAALERKPSDDIPDFTPGNGNKAERRATALVAQLQVDLTERDELIDQLRSGYVFETGPYEVELSEAQWSAALSVFENYNMGDDKHFVFLEEQGRGVISEILIEIGVARAPDADEVSE